MPIVTIRLSEEEYKKLQEEASRKGFNSVSEYVKKIIIEGAKAEAPLKPAEPRQETQVGASQLLRRLQDMINPFTAKVDELARNLAEMIERIEALDERLKRVEEILAKAPQQPLQPAPAPARTRRGRLSAIERLKQEGVVFQRDLSWLNNPRAFFDKLRREGAIVIEVGGQYVAADPGFWDDFLKAVTRLGTDDPEEAERILGGKMAQLFRTLLDAGLIFYDQLEKRWIVSIE